MNVAVYLLIMSDLKEWRESAQDMYERLDNIILSWPSLSIEWMNNDVDGRNVLTATYSMQQEDEFVNEVRVDTQLLNAPAHQIREYLLGANEALSVRQCGKYFAAFCEGGDIFVFNKDEETPILKFKGSTKEAGGFGLAFEPQADPHSAEISLVSGSERGELVMWSLKADFKEQHELKRVSYDCDINGVSWTHPDRVVVALGTGDVDILDRDLHRVKRVPCFKKECMTASLNPRSEYMLLAGSADEGFAVFDTRTNQTLYQNETHESEIRVLNWSPTRDLVVASAGADCNIYIWDLRKAGDEQSYDDAQDGAPELMFKHIGHSSGSTLNDFCFHPTIDMLVASCDGKNVLMTWRPNKEATDDVTVPPMPAYITNFLS